MKSYTKLVVGCGNRPKDYAINLDMIALPSVDVVWNLESIPYPFDAGQFEYVEAEDILEHVDDIVGIMNELGRIMCVGGLLWIRGPHAAYPLQAWKDPTHRRAFVPESFDNFDSQLRKAQYAHYFGNVDFQVIDEREVREGMEYVLIKRSDK